MLNQENKKGVIRRRNYKDSSFKKGKNYLLVIGIDKYIHCKSLNNAVSDAKAIVKVLIERFEFEKENTRQLYNEDATKRNIIKSLEYFVDVITDEDNFIVYYSGHGEFKERTNMGYWIPVEGEEKEISDFIPNILIKNYLGEIKSHHSFIMVDSCFSGDLFNDSLTRSNRQYKERKSSRWGLSSGGLEEVSDGKVGYYSPFASCVLNEFRSAERPIAVSELCNKVMEIVPSNSDQEPRGDSLNVKGHKGGQFVFYLKNTEIADFEYTIKTNNLASHLLFVNKYPNSKYSLKLNKRIIELKAIELFNEINNTKDDSRKTVLVKLALIDSYVKDYHEQQHFDEVLKVGQFLEYKKEFFKSINSEYALRRFLREPIPDIIDAKAIHSEAKSKLTKIKRKNNNSLESNDILHNENQSDNWKKILLLVITLFSILILFYIKNSHSSKKSISKEIKSYLDKAESSLSNSTALCFLFVDSAKTLTSNENEQIFIDEKIKNLVNSIDSNKHQFITGYYFLGNSRTNDHELYDPDISDKEGRFIHNSSNFKQLGIYSSVHKEKRTIREKMPSPELELKNIKAKIILPPKTNFIVLDSIKKVRLNDTKYWAKIGVDKGDLLFDNFFIWIDPDESYKLNQDELNKYVISLENDKFYIGLIAYSKIEYAYKQLKNMIRKGFSEMKIINYENENGKYFYLTFSNGFTKEKAGLNMLDSLKSQYKFRESPRIFQLKKDNALELFFRMMDEIDNNIQNNQKN